MQAFFTLKSGLAPGNGTSATLIRTRQANVPVQNESTAPMKLVFAGPEGKAIIEQEKDQALAGRKVFLENCAICHSSKQPEDFQLNFSLELGQADRISFGQ